MDLMIPIWYALWKTILLFFYPGISLFLIACIVSGLITADEETSTKAGAAVYRVVLAIGLMLVVGATGAVYYSDTGNAWRNKLFESYPAYSKSVVEDYQKASEAEPTKVLLSKEIHQFYLVGFNPPKHAYASIKHVRSGIVYESLYVSKHCPKTPVLFDTYNVVVQPYYMSDKPTEIKWDFPNLYQEFCN